MDKRDEIREGIADRLYSWLPCTDDEAVYCAAQLTKYLDSVDVVIKAIKELPYLNCGKNKKANEAQLDMRDRMLNTGYVTTERLIKE